MSCLGIYLINFKIIIFDSNEYKLPKVLVYFIVWYFICAFQARSEKRRKNHFIIFFRAFYVRKSLSDYTALFFFRAFYVRKSLCDYTALFFSCFLCKEVTEWLYCINFFIYVLVLKEETTRNKKGHKLKIK